MKMRNNRSNGFAILLVILGGLIVLGKLTPLLSSIFGLVVPILIIGLGYYGIRRGNAFFGWIILFIGIMSLLAKLAWIIIPLIGIALIVYGISALQGRRGH